MCSSDLCVSVLHGVLALRGGALVVPTVCLPQPDGSALLQAFEPLDIPEDATPARVAQLCWERYEPIIRANPGLWLWPYKHFRYKPHATAVEYPSYANEWDAFDKLRTESFAASESGGRWALARCIPEQAQGELF